MERKFDRIPQFDERSRNYPIRALIRTADKPRSYTWKCNITLDQGPDGACTGFAVTHEAAARPAVVKGLTYDDAMWVYNRAKQLDVWEGEDYDGSSVLAAMKAGVERGWYEEYRWAFGEEDLAHAVGHFGPAVLGINWYEGMLEPDEKFRIRPTGRVVGGHAILCNGYSFRKRLYRLHNSWGPYWGQQGAAYITKEDMARLLSEQGEACIPVKRLVV